MYRNKKIGLLVLAVLLVSGSFAMASNGSNSAEERAKEYYSLGKIYKEHGLVDHAAGEFQKAYDIMKVQPLVKKAEKKPIAKNVQRGQYIVGVADTLNISVWENADLTRSVKVRPDGKVSFPLIDEFDAVGKTIPQIDDLITEKLKDYLRYPDVSVTLEGMGGRRVIILGEVKSPGIIALGDMSTVLEAIAIAGGPTSDAVLRSVLVIKGGLSNPVPQRVNIARFLKKPSAADNVVLGPQDIVYVPETFLSDITYKMNQILAPLASGRVAYGDVKFYEDITP